MKPLLLLAILPAVLFCQTPSFPGSLANDRQLMVAANQVQSSLGNSIGIGDTTLTLASGNGFLNNMIITVDSEIMSVCSAVGNVIQVGRASCPNIDGRGFDGSAITTHTAGAAVSNFVAAWYHNAMAQEVKAVESALGVNLSNVATAGVRTANQFLAGPASGAPASAGWRAMVAADLPATITSNTTGSAAFVTR